MFYVVMLSACGYVLGLFAYSTWADIECKTRGYDTSYVSLVFTSVCETYPWNKGSPR
jgi:hypothetical protein